MTKEFKSKVYKAVKGKDGKCVLVKKERPKRRVVVKRKQPVQEQTQQAQQVLPPSFNQIQQAAQKREAVISQRDQALTARQQSIKQALTTQRQANQIEALSRAILNTGTQSVSKITPPPKTKSVFEQKSDLVKQGTKPSNVQTGIPLDEVLSKQSKSKKTGSVLEELDLGRNMMLNKIKDVFREEDLDELNKQSNDGLKDLLESTYPDVVVDIPKLLTNKAKKEYISNLTFEDSVGYAEPPAEQSGGANGKIEGGMYNDEIEDIMKSHKSFKGAIAADKIPDIQPARAVSFVINKDKTGEPGSHWCGVYLDSVLDKEVCYYDPLGNPPSAEVVRDLKDLVRRINPKHQLKFKINTMKNQRNDTDTCAWQSMRFIKDMIAGKTFKEATGYCDEHKNNTDHFEKKAVKLANKFGYI